MDTSALHPKADICSAARLARMINDKRQVIYAKSELPVADQLRAARAIAE